MAFLITPATLTTPLDAVNMMLSSLGESPIATLSPPPTSDAEEALARLNEVDLQEQSKGWSWNKEFEYTLTKDGSNNLPLPDQTLRMSLSAVSWGSFDIVQRGSKVYDREHHTFVFSGAVPKVDLIVRQDWDTTPQPYRTYVALEACRRFHAGKQGSGVVLQVNAQDLRDARAALEQHEDETDPKNTVTGNMAVMQGLYGTGGLRRNRR